MGTLGHGSSFDHHKWLSDALARAAKTCSSQAKSATAELETTLDEIVDVVHVELGPVRDAVGEKCVREALWQVALPPEFRSTFETHGLSATL